MYLKCIFGIIFASVGVIFLYFVVSDKSAFAALVQALATIILVGVTAIYVYELKESSISYPIIGVSKVEPEIITKQGLPDTYENIVGVKMHFFIKNMGQKPGRLLNCEARGKIADTTLPFTASAPRKNGSIIYPGSEGFNISTIGKDVLDRMMNNNETLVYAVNIQYQSLDRKKQYSSSEEYYVSVKRKEPFEISVSLPLAS